MSGIRIKNWEKFQHYQTGKNAAKRPPWIKLYTELLDDIEFHQLDGRDAKTLILLWALASENGGALPPIKEIAFRLRLSEKEINSILGRLPQWLEAPAYENPRTDKEEDREEDKMERGAIAPPKRATQVKEDWEPSLETISLLETNKGFPRRAIDAELEKFRNHHRSKGTVFKDTDAAFRNWMMKAREFATRDSPLKPGPIVAGPWKPFKPEPPEPPRPSAEERERQVLSRLKPLGSAP
jgi:hypothetical protein